MKKEKNIRKNKTKTVGKRKIRKKMIKYLILTLIITTIIVSIIYKISTDSEKNAIDENTVNQEQGNISKPKEIDGLEIISSKISDENGIFKLEADIKNPSNEEKGGYLVNITLLDVEGKTIDIIQGYLNTVNPNSESKFELNATIQPQDVYDYTINKE